MIVIALCRGLSWMGSSRYMAPEIYQNSEYDGRQIDIWSVGITLMTCLLGDYTWFAPTRVPVPSQGIYR